MTTAWRQQITNDTYYIATNKNGGVIKTPILEDAQRFYNVNGKPTNGKKKRKKYSEDVRKMIYYKADGRCVLCGRKILYKNMTLDHVVTLAMGGADEVENLACTCFICNQFKGLILPDDLLDRITQIFLYQMNKKHCSNWKWKIIRKILLKLSTDKQRMSTLVENVLLVLLH